LAKKNEYIQKKKRKVHGHIHSQRSYDRITVPKSPPLKHLKRSLEPVQDSPAAKRNKMRIWKNKKIFNRENKNKPSMQIYKNNRNLLYNPKIILS